MLFRDLVASASGLLSPERYHDYLPNGLQVDTRRDVRKIVTGVSACLELIEAAAAAGADAILVHHGWFWKREDPRITGMRYRRIERLLASGMGLAAFHLPLDDNPEIGNNALLGQALGFVPEGRFGEENLGWIGGNPHAETASELALRVARCLEREPLVLGPSEIAVRRVAWCSGAGQDMIEDAAAAGADCFVSGEVSERTTYAARELGIAYIAAGHHATERFGIRALGRWLADKHGIEAVFIDTANPV